MVAFQYLLFAILNVNVRRAILLVVLDGKAIAGRWALVTEAVVPGTDFLNAQGAEGGVICTTVTGNSFDEEFRHDYDVAIGSVADDGFAFSVTKVRFTTMDC